MSYYFRNQLTFSFVNVGIIIGVLQRHHGVYIRRFLRGDSGLLGVLLFLFPA